METCLKDKTHLETWLWVEPHIYHSTREAKREWRDTTASQTLSHPNQTQKNQRKNKLEETPQKLKKPQRRDTYAKLWRELRQNAQDETKKISEDLQGTRQKKLVQKKRIMRGTCTPTQTVG